VNREQAKQWLQQQLGRKIEMPVILSLTRLVARKGVDDTLRACAMLRKQYPDLSFIYCIAGSGPDQDRLKKLVEELDLDNLVYFLGRVEDSDLPMLYGSADIFCMPSRKDGPDVEGFGIVFLEAAAAGVPSIGSRSGGIPDAIKDQKTGLLVPEKNIEALANALHTLLVDEAYRHQLSQEAKQYVATMNWERIGTDIYERMKSYA
jgi:phosphatidylinositol alpha-1,6-mannosyltransferase